MSELILYEGPAADTPPAGGITVYPKIDKKLYWKDDSGTETPFYPTGAGTGDLLSDGTVPMTANWNMGNFQITMGSLILTTATGQPLQVTSTDMVTNLNADLLDGNHASAFQPAGTYLEAADIDTLAELNAIVTDATLGDSADFATAAQGALADTALQPAAIGTTVQGYSAVLQATTASFLIADETKLDGIEASADVTDEANTVAALSGATLTAVTVATDDKVLIQDTSDTDNLKTVTAQSIADLAASADPSASNNVQTGTTYTIQASDNGKNIIFTNASAIAVTLPDTLATNFQCTVVQFGTGVPTVTPNTDTINGAGTGVAPAAQYKGLYLTQHTATVWLALF